MAMKHMACAFFCTVILLGSASGFNLEIDGKEYSWDVIGRFVIPDDTLHLAILDSGAHTGWAVPAGRLVETGPGRMDRFVPDQPGLWILAVGFEEEIKTVNVFVMVPFDSLKNGMLNGYEIGRYPDTNQFPNFNRPCRFIKVTQDNIDTRISPRYTLHEFVSRQTGHFPKFLVLRENLILKLELLTDIVKHKGHRCEKLTVFSGFRTPAVQRRRGFLDCAHMYGGAADIYVDADSNGIMDDLNGDGHVSWRDARLLAAYVDELEKAHPELVGGCGWYHGTSSHGPFVHVDVRGERTRWHQ